MQILYCTISHSILLYSSFLVLSSRIYWIQKVFITFVGFWEFGVFSVFVFLDYHGHCTVFMSVKVIISCSYNTDSLNYFAKKLSLNGSLFLPGDFIFPAEPGTS